MTIETEKANKMDIESEESLLKKPEEVAMSLPSLEDK